MDYRSVFARPPLFFSAAADAIELAVKESRFDHFFHYIDDFVLLGLPGSVKCERGLLCLQQVCENLGFFFVLSSLIRRSWCFGYLPKNLKGPSLSSLSGKRDARAACWGMESLVCIMQHASTCCHRRRSSRQSQAKQRKPGGARIVGLVQLRGSVRERCADVHLWSDASGSWGCGALWQGLWFQVAWDLLPIASASIALKECFRF